MKVLRSDSPGYTLIELMVSILILSILSLTVWQIFSVSYSSINRIKAGVKDNSQLLLLTNLLRYEVNGLHVPFWLTEPDFLEEDTVSNKWEFLENVVNEEGEVEEKIRFGLYAEDGSLSFNNGDYVFRFPNIKSFDMEYMITEEKAEGFHFLFYTQNGAEIPVEARFGSQAISVQGADDGS